jgi:uncharacterized membrane protein YheB (UPF0754 family)
MQLTKEYIKNLILEEMTKSDVKDIVSKEVEKQLRHDVPKAVEKELGKMLKSKDIKADIGEIAKKVIKKLYKDLSFHHPYIIDRIKV